MILSDLLAGGPHDSILVADDEFFSRAILLDKVERLKSDLRPYEGAMVVSNEALTVIASLVAAQALNIPLWIGHAYLDENTLEEIWDQQSIDVQVNNGAKISSRPRLTTAHKREDFCVHIMTSGTTGIPKIARHSIDGLMARVNVGKLFSGSWLLTYPPTTFAGIQVLLTALASKSNLVAYTTLSVPRLADALSKHAITSVSGTPTFWRTVLMALPDSATEISLRQITIGGEIVDQVLLDRLAARFPNARIAHIYASTEAGALFSVRDRKAGFPADWLSQGIDGVELRMRNEMLEVRTKRSMNSYVSGHTNPYTDDGWLQTGDLVEISGARVRFRGRNDDVINVGGAKVLPQEVETVVLGVAGVADVRVTGVKNPLTGYVLKAEVTTMPTTDFDNVRAEILRRCYDMLPAYKVPRLISSVTDIRISAAGKKVGGDT